MKARFRYDAMFLYASLQSVGHTIEYFSKHTRRLVVFIVMPRVNNAKHLLRVYENGKLLSEQSVDFSSNIFLYYLRWFFYHNVFLLRYFSRLDRVIVLAGHPLAFFGMSVMRLLRPVTYAYWVGDYYPPVNWSLVLFEKLKKFYHDRVAFSFYLSDSINRKLNGVIRTDPLHHTVMWGMAKPENTKSVVKRGYLNLLFVGVIKPGQGLEDVIAYVGNHPEVRLSIIGSCVPAYVGEINRYITTSSVGDRIFFPNMFYSEDKLRDFARRHHIGVAMYVDSPNSASFYTDPGKIKTYLELGLPVVMTDTSPIAPFVKKFRCGEVIRSGKDLTNALDAITRHYDRYQTGVREISRYFSYERYYKDAFKALEGI